jgi:RNA polymerase sigma factor (sigma-70 family)
MREDIHSTALAHFIYVTNRAAQIAAAMPSAHGRRGELHSVLVDFLIHHLPDGGTTTSMPTEIFILAQAKNPSFDSLRRAFEAGLDELADTDQDHKLAAREAAELLAMAVLIEKSSLGTHGARSLRDSTSDADLTKIVSRTHQTNKAREHPVADAAVTDVGVVDDLQKRGAAKKPEAENLQTLTPPRGKNQQVTRVTGDNKHTAAAEITTTPAKVSTPRAHVSHAPSDAELITATREGSSEAYAELYSRHRASAYNLARQLARSSAEADDLVSEAFAKLLDTVRSGGGPDTAFRAYLLTALRHRAYDRTRRDRRIEFTDTALAGLNRSLVARAFATLPERWQTVLWHTEIEGQHPADIATLFGLSPNGVSALAYRAREGLRQAYLQMHLADRAMTGASRLQRCRAASERLGAWTRGGLSRRETAQVDQHLDECERCRTVATELAVVNDGLRKPRLSRVLVAALV